MKKQTAISYYGSQVRLAKAAGVSKQAVWNWGEFVPPTIAELLHKNTNGALQYDPSAYPDTYRRPGGRLWTPTPQPSMGQEAAA